VKLNIVPARRGIHWVKQGIKTFFKQPLAMIGLFFMFMAAMSIATLLPFIGSVIAMMFLPGATLGLMAASKESTAGKFPMPSILVMAFRAGQQRLRAMLILGALYAAALLLVMGVTTLVDGGQFARLYLFGGKITDELLNSNDFVSATWLAMGLYIPVSMVFWHAPGLVHWYGVSPVKSLFFSGVACLRNVWAYAVYSAAWLGIFLAMGLTVTTVAALSGNPGLLGVLLLPSAMLIVSVFFTSIYFTFEDSFVPSDADTPTPEESQSP